MTAINAVANAVGAWLITDSASYLPSGKIVGFSAKTVVLAHLDMAIAVSGAISTQNEIVQQLSAFGSFDEAISGIAEQLRSAWDEGAFELSAGANPELDHFQLFMIGWSDHLKCGKCFAITTMDDRGMVPFSLIENDTLITPGLEMNDLERAGCALDGVVSYHDPEIFLQRVINYQRSHPRPKERFGDTEDVYVVGGHVVLTQIDASGISQKVVKRWPDELDSFINPALAAAEQCEPPAGLSRQMRRAWMRQNRPLAVVKSGRPK